MRWPYLWVFAGAWVGLTAVAWVTGDWNAYSNRGYGGEVKFRMPVWVQFAVSAFFGAVGAALATALVAAAPAVRRLSGSRRS